MKDSKKAPQQYFNNTINLRRKKIETMKIIVQNCIENMNFLTFPDKNSILSHTPVSMDNTLRQTLMNAYDKYVPTRYLKQTEKTKKEVIYF